MRQLVAVVFAFLCLVVHPALAATLLATPADLAAVLPKAIAGDVIQLAPGKYPAGLTLMRRAGLTFVGGPGVELGPVNLVGTTDIAFQDVDARLVPSASTPATAAVVRVVDSKGFSWRGGSVASGLVEGSPVGRGFSLERSSDLSIRGASVSTVHKGIVFSKVDGLYVGFNDVVGVRTSPITGGYLTRAVFEWNLLGRSTPISYGTLDHADMLHIWAASSGDAVRPAPSADIRIVNNGMIQGDGFPIMGVYLDDNGQAVGFDRVDVWGNLLLSGHGQGLLAENVRGLSVLDNVLLQSGSWRGTDPRDAPSIRLVAGTVASEIRGNRSADVYKLFAAWPGNETVAPGIRPAAELDAATKAWEARRAAARTPAAKPPPADARDAEIAALKAELAKVSAAADASAARAAELAAQLVAAEARATATAAELETQRTATATALSQRDAAMGRLAAVRAAVAEPIF